MEVLGITQFERCVLDISLINLCDRESYVSQEMHQLYNAWKEETAEPINNPWLDLHQFTIYIPHPDQQYENIPLAEGLTRGYNIEVEPVQDKSEIPPLAALSLDVVIDPENGEYRPLVVKHPIVRDYPQDWEKQLIAFLKKEIASEDLPELVRYVDRTLNQDYRPPSWEEISGAINRSRGFLRSGAI